jgi:DNA-binding NarL/FixJ family response regulator
MRRKLQVLIVDDEGLMRDGLCALISLEEGFAVAGAICGTTAVQTVSLPTGPDVIIADFGALAVQGAELVIAARERWPSVRILVLTLQMDDESIEAALRAGVDGFLFKTDPRSDLLSALRAVMEGRRYISPPILERLANGFVTQQGRTKQESDGLSDREREVMKMIAGGLRTREIAERLSVSHKTVEKHRTNLMRKLGVRSAAAVAAYAISNGYLQT